MYAAHICYLGRFQSYWYGLMMGFWAKYWMEWSRLDDGWIPLLKTVMTTRAPMVLKTFADNFLFQLVAYHFLFKDDLLTIFLLKTVVHNFLFKTFCSPLLAACLLGPDVPLCCPLNEVWPFVKEVGLRFFHQFLSNFVQSVQLNRLWSL